VSKGEAKGHFSTLAKQVQVQLQLQLQVMMVAIRTRTWLRLVAACLPTTRLFLHQIQKYHLQVQQQIAGHQDAQIDEHPCRPRIISMT
jgi:hypothetical protein